MKRTYASLLLVVTTLGFAVAGCGGDDEDEATATTEVATQGNGTSGDGTTLNGSVGPGFDISIEGADGLSPGSYTLVVDDKSSAHNFHLTGPGGVDVATDVSAEGEESFEIELAAGEYTFVCDPHASQMRGTFTVG